ncbi:hypothetical protein CAEBREN_22347 [Caenorhabditis brenneri]|uniref:Uncharacterized protein n=1 Tax=Caenorhabditis brenneri TaxID=135651 RepID=G0NXG0_CAEBE|nr:hypothetical protein CAEBREN_22347 [Caenorhabditis brenneri]
MNKEEKEQATENFKKSAELAKNLTEIADNSFVRFNDAKVRQAWKEVLNVVTKSGQAIRGMENFQAGPGDPMIEQMDELAEELEKLFNQVSINIFNMKTLSEKNFSKRILSPTYLLTRYMKNCVSNPVAQAKDKLIKAYEAQVPLKLAYALLSILEIKATNPIGKSSDLEMHKWKDVIELVLALLMFVEAFVNGLLGRNSVINLDLLIQATIKIFDQLRKFDNENSDDARKREEEERKRKEEEERRKKEEEEKRKREEEETRRKKEEEEKRKREEEEERKKKEEEEKMKREEEEERQRKEEEERKKREEEEERKRKEEEERKRREEEERKKKEEDERRKKEEEERKRREEEERKKKEEEERKKKEEEERTKKEEEERKRREEEERKKKEEEERKKREEEEARRKEEEEKKNAWFNIKPWAEQYLESNRSSWNSTKADKIREKVEQSIPGQAFYVAVFDQANKPADYSFYNPHGDNQLIWITAKGRCDCLIYRSLTGNQESAQNHANLKSRVESYVGFGKNITYDRSMDPTMEYQIMSKESWKNNFVFMIFTIGPNPEIRWANSTHNGGPGWTGRIIMKDVNRLNLLNLLNNREAFLLSAFP